MYTFQDCQELVTRELENIRLEGAPAELYEPIRYILSSGGKRIRPCLTLMGCNLFNDNVDIAINAALAVEVFHNFTLVHDDIMDKAETRRNNPTVHKKWNENVAILSGDAMLIKSYEYITGCPGGNIKKMLALFNKTAIQVCEGQQYDMNYESRSDVSIEEYLKMIEYKTAVLIASSLKMGAIAGAANESDAGLLYEFGRNIGIAFQLQDDMLDVYAQSQTFGKAIGGDIIANKKTYLLVSALNSEDRNIVSELKKWIERPVVNKEEKIRAVRGIFDKLGLKDRIHEKIDNYFESGLKYLDQVSVKENRKDNLRHLANKMMIRES